MQRTQLRPAGSTVFTSKIAAIRNISLSHKKFLLVAPMGFVPNVAGNLMPIRSGHPLNPP
jgi:hypothetical protein